MRNPIQAVRARVENSVKEGVQERVRTHFEENKRTYYACAITALAVATITSRVRPSITNVTVINNLP